MDSSTSADPNDEDIRDLSRPTPAAEAESRATERALAEARAERRVALDALLGSDRRLRIAVEMSRLSVYDWDPVTGALNWDARLKAMWGLPADADVDFDVFASGLHPEDREDVLAACRRAIDPAGDGVYEAEFRVIGLTDHVERWVMARGRTFFENGKPVGYVGGAMDITERKRAEERLEKKVAERTAQLAASNTQLEDYVYTIAHDLRAPLRSMQSFSKLLLDEYASHLDETAQTYAQRVVRAAESLDRMVTDLLAYSRVMRIELAVGAVNVAHVWAAAVAQQEQTIKERRARIEATSDLTSVAVRAHHATLVQVLSNLLSNALKFVAPNVEPHISVSHQVHGERVRIWVADNGIGIAAEFHEKIFRVFERLHGKAYGGTGIGLAIVRTGIVRMGGEVGVESEPGHGARFWIELPRAVAAAD